MPVKQHINQAMMRVPRRHRLTLVTWMGVYPILTLVALLAEPLLGSVPIAVRTLVMSAMMVPVMVHFVMPFMKRNFLREGQ